jgi:hypothetical protein
LVEEGGELGHWTVCLAFATNSGLPGASTGTSFSIGVRPPNPERIVRGCSDATKLPAPASLRKSRRPRYAPEFFVIDSMTAFDLAVLFRAMRLDVAHANPEFTTQVRVTTLDSSCSEPVSRRLQPFSTCRTP